MNFFFINQHPRKRVPNKKLLMLLYQIPVREIHGKKDISIVWVDDASIAKLSKKFGRAFHTTDILTFPVEEKNSPLAGEIIISLDTASRQAKSRKVPLIDELLLLIIHGVLHLQGFDDEAQKDWRKMKEAEYAYFMHISGKAK